MTTPVVIPPVATTDENVELVGPVPQEPEEPVAAHKGEQQQPQIDEVPQAGPSDRPQRVRKSAIPDYYEVYNSEEI
jgi:hypothetical protein